MDEAGVEAQSAPEDSFVTHLFGFFQRVLRWAVVDEIERAILGVIGVGGRAWNDPVVFGGAIGRGDEEHLAAKAGTEFISDFQGFAHLPPKLLGGQAILNSLMTISVGAKDFKGRNI